MPKVTIHIHQIGPGNFDVRHSGKHQMTATYSEAKAVARDMQASLGGFENAVVYDHVREPN